MDPKQVVRGDDGTMRCRECGFPYNLSPRQVVDRSGAGMEAFAAAVQATPNRVRGKRPNASTWSINAYVCHLAQAAEVILSRVKLITEQSGPPLPYHEQDEAVEIVRGDEVPAEESLQVLRKIVSEFQDYAKAIPTGGWERTGTHAHAGAIRLLEVAHDMPHELEHHARDVGRIAHDLQRMM